MSEPLPDPNELAPLEIKIGVFRDWLHKKAGPRVAQNDGQVFAGWEKRLATLLADVRKKPQVPIALVGSTGSGKSTLLNALLGVEVLPVSNMKPCTAVVTSVRYSPGPVYQATITFLSRAAWDEELGKLKETFRAGDKDDDTEGADEWQIISRSTKDKICAVYGLDKESVEQMPDLDALKLDPQMAGCLAGEGSRIFLEAATAKELKQKLRDYLSSEERYWPLIKTVEVTGPFDALRHGAVLIDLPGVNDPNQAREEVTRSFLRDAPFIWIAFNTKRGMTKDIHELLVKQDLLRQFLMHGKHDAVTFIGTHADDFDPEQAIDEFSLDADATNAEIIRERSRRVVKQVRADLEDISTELAHVANAKFDDLERLKHTLAQTKVFVVSTRAYMQLQKISQGRKDYGIERVDDSGVPAVVRHLSEVCRKQDMRAHHEDIGRRLGFVVEEVRGFFLARISQIELQQGALRQKADQLKARLAGPRTTLATETDRIRERASLRFDGRREQFESGIKLAADRARHGLDDRFDRWRGMHHMTLRACMVRDGEFSSSNGNHYDFNRDIALPLLESIPFTWDDFFGQHLRESLAEVREQLKARGEVFLERLKSEASQSGVFASDRIASLSSDIELSQRNIEFHVEEKTNGVLRTIQRKRSQLADGISNTIRKSMLDAYAKAKDETGVGMKASMLRIITNRARQSCDQLFDNILAELTDGVVELGLQFNHDLRELSDIVGQQADRVSGNLGLGAVQHQAQSVESTRHALDELVGELGGMQPAPELLTVPVPA
jgi:energy-coupling factor transporter ATP-binding protein EcfA2